MSDDDTTTLICDPEAFSVCPCSGEQYSCDCDPNEAGTECTACNSTLVRIDFNTGEPVARSA